ncbi:MAG: sigma-70 family RNA polymerase sigma factor [Planctomycetes bacterium]|nr:sigma-70 family RNA polymerase sigma factor [Planctomycetota bacterium]
MATRPPPDPWLDHRLTAAARGGDAEAFEQLYTRYRDWVVSLALRYTRNRDDALDVLQETFLYFLRKLPEFRPRAELTTFLYPVVRNLALTRRRKRRPELAGEEILIEAPAPEPVDHDHSRRELAAVLRGLAAGQHEVLLLRFVDGLALEEIAAALAIPLGTVKSRLHHALRTLREDARTREYFDRDTGKTRAE